MYVLLRCKRSATSQSSTTGVLSETLSTVWTRWLDLQPAKDEADQLRESPAAKDVVRLFNVFARETTLDVVEGDVLVKMDANGTTETQVSYKVRGVGHWTGHTAILAEEIER